MFIPSCIMRLTTSFYIKVFKYSLTIFAAETNFVVLVDILAASSCTCSTLFCSAVCTYSKCHLHILGVGL